MASYRLEIMGKVMGLSKEEIEKATPVREINVTCICEAIDGSINKTHVKLKRIADEEGTIIGGIGQCPNCGKVFYL